MITRNFPPGKQFFPHGNFNFVHKLLSFPQGPILYPQPADGTYPWGQPDPWPQMSWYHQGAGAPGFSSSATPSLNWFSLFQKQGQGRALEEEAGQEKVDSWQQLSMRLSGVLRPLPGAAFPAHSNLQLNVQ